MEVVDRADPSLDYVVTSTSHIAQLCGKLRPIASFASDAEASTH
jgi:hypothetical protein